MPRFAKVAAVKRIEQRMRTVLWEELSKVPGLESDELADEVKLVRRRLEKALEKYLDDDAG